MRLKKRNLPFALPEVEQCHLRCHGEFGTPNLWHLRAKYLREIGTPYSTTLLSETYGLTPVQHEAIQIHHV